MGGLREDLRYAVRRLASRPGFTLLATMTLALGIGASTAIFSVLDSVLLRPLPYRDPDQLVQLWETNPDVVKARNFPFSDVGVNAHNYLEYRSQATAFTDLGYVTPYTEDGMIQVGGGEGPAERVWAWSVSGSVFTVLGVQPMLGRAFLPEERAPPGQWRWTDVVILSHALWQRRFGSDSGIVGRKITIEAGPATVVGVMPPGFVIPPMYFRGAVLYHDAGIYVPLFYQAFEQPRRFRQFRVIGRLKPGVTVAKAEAEVKTIARRLEAAYPEANDGWTAVVTPLHELLGRDFGGGLGLLMGAVGVVLLIACGNVASLLIAQGAARRTELAVRTALGAGRARLARLLFTESTLLALVGGAVGLALAAWGTRLLVALVPADVPRAAESGIDLRVLGFALALALVTGIAVGMAPAFWSSQIDPHQDLKVRGAERASGPGGRQLARVLVGGQIALAFVLLIGGGLLAKSFVRLHRTDPGYDPAHLLVGTLQFGAHHSLTEFSTTRLGPEEARLRDQRKYSFTHHALERIRALPGVTAAASSGLSPLVGGSGYWPLKVDGRPDEKRNALVAHASPDYLRTMGLPLLRGEGFPAWDGVSEAERYHWAGGCPGAAQYCVAIVSETLARTVWPGDDPIGKRVGIYDCCVTVVGVVPDVRYRGVDDPVLSSEFDDRVQMYLPGTGPELLIRTTVEPTTLIDAVRAIVLDLAGEAVVDFTTLDRRQTVSLARPRFYAVLVGLFAAVAATLALVGLYGVIAYSVGRRTREIGLRMALGAERNDVRAMVLRQGMTPVAAGIVAGAAGALALGRLLAGLLYGMDPADPIVIGLLAAAMVLVSLGATYLPARRASNVALMDALRHE